MGHADITTTMVYVHFMPHADDAARLTRAFSFASHGRDRLAVA